MQTLRLAARMYKGYKLKALSLLVFVAVGLGLIMLAFDLLYNSFNAYFDRHASYFLPRYFVAGKADLDLFDGDYTIADLAIEEEGRQALLRELGPRFEMQDVAYFWAMFKFRRNSARTFYALVIGLDFDRMETAFPFFSGKLSAEDRAAYKAKPLLMVDSELTRRVSLAPGDELTLLSVDYFKDYNGIKVGVREIRSTPMIEDQSMSLPIVYIDLSHLRRLLAMPEGIGLPFLLTPKLPARSLSLADSKNMARLREASQPLGLTAYSAVTASKDLYKTFALYRGVLVFFSAFLVVVMIASISATLAINFQNRRADFGLMKAFGCSNRRILGLLLCENALGLALPLGLACAMNLVAGWTVKPFKVVSNFTVSPKASLAGALIVFAAALLIWLVSSIRPYRYLKRIDPVEILRED